jgi:hypothetical protein
LLFACGNKVDIPSGILPDSTMEKILVEFVIIDAARNISLNGVNIPKFRSELFYEATLKKMKIKRETFNNSLQFYGQHPELLQKIYENAQIELTKRQAALNKR